MTMKISKVVKFQKIQLENLVDFEKCCKTHIFLQKSVPIQPKTSNILPKFCQKLATTLRVRRADAGRPRTSRRSARRSWTASPGGRALRGRGRREAREAGPLGVRGSKIGKISIFLQIFGGLVLGCVKTKFCKKVCV